jgi:spore coat protein H
MVARPRQVASDVRPHVQGADLQALTQAGLFEPTRIWTAQLSLTADQWNAMQPTFGAQARGSGDDWLQSVNGGRNGWGTVRGLEFAYVHADLEFEGTRFSDVALRFKGNGTFANSRGAPTKNSLKVDLNKFVKGQKIAGVSTLNFHNNVTDEGLLNETVAYRLFRDGGVPAPRTAWVRVFLTVSGRHDRRYLGLYSLVENVDTNFIQARFPGQVGGILKPSTRNPFLDRGDRWARYHQTYDPKTDLTESEQQHIIGFSKFVSTAGESEFAARIGQYVDVDEFARYLAVVVWLADLDGMLERGQNYYAHLPPGNGPLVFVPWDQDHTFGTWAKVEPGRYDTLSVDPPWGSSVKVRFLERMNRVPAFRAAYRARLREFSQTIFQSDRIAPFIATVARSIRPAVMDEPFLVSRFDRSAAGQAGIVPFAALRTKSVLEQLSR